MADEQWRIAFRAWQANPSDDELAQRALAATRRAAAPAPLELLERERTDEMTFSSRLKFAVEAEAGDGQLLGLGDTPGDVIVPSTCRAWWVRPCPARVTARVIEEVRRSGAPGLSLERAHVDAAGLTRVATLGAQLQRLSLRSCKKLASGALAPLAELPSLHSLDLSSAAGVDRAALETVGRLSRLARLWVGPQHSLESDDLAPLARHENLGELSLRRSKRLGDPVLDHLSTIRSLRALDLSQCLGLTDRGLAALFDRVSLLRRVALAGCEVGSAAVAALGRVRGLCSLDLRLCRGIAAADLGALEGCSLEALDLSEMATDAHIESLAPLAGSLRVLTIRGIEPGLGTAGLTALGRLSHLESLDAEVRKQTALFFKSLEGLPLRRLVVRTWEHKPIDGEALLRLPSTLEDFSLFHVCGADSLVDVALHLGRLTGLRCLSLKGRIEAAACRHLAALPALKVLELSGTELDLDVVRTISTLPALEELSLQPFTGWNAELLRELGNAPRLRRLAVAHLDVPAVVRAALEARNVDIVFALRRLS